MAVLSDLMEETTAPSKAGAGSSMEEDRVSLLSKGSKP